MDKKRAILLVLLVVFVVAAYLIFSGSVNIAQAPTNDSSPSGSLVEVSNMPAADFIMIDRVVLDKPGYVMIHKSVNGKPADIVMTGDLLPAGESVDVLVRTDYVTSPGDKYFAMLHYDDGNRVYDNPQVDPPVVRNGSIVEAELTIE